VLPDEAAVAACDIRGGAPGTREMDALDPAALVEAIHGVVLSGGSVFGLDAASGAVEWLAGRGVGFTFGAHPCPAPSSPPPSCSTSPTAATRIGPSSGGEPPYRALGRQACEAAGRDFALGNAGAGLGATAGRFKGGLGSASVVWHGVTVGALVAVNSFGSPADPLTGDLWAAPYAIAGEYPHAHGLAAGFRPPGAWTKADRVGATESGAGANTTIAVVATDAALTKPEARRLAIMAADGMARALRPVHTPFDGDSVIALATGRIALDGPRPLALSALGTLAADTLARAIGRAIWQADAIPGWPAWRDGPGAAD
jgi:L-aminopeptidase/D-esterase-like protein